MDSAVAIAVITAVVNVSGLVASHLGLRAKLDRQQGDRHAGTARIEQKLDQVKGINETQIVASNNFNQKFAKLETQANRIERDVIVLHGKLNRVVDDVKTLADGTGIAVG